MSIPLPPIDLEGHCSAINDETLYVLSPGGFQSLPLKKQAKWAKEAVGVSVTGPACVVVGEGADTALWAIGGTSDDTTFDGLQRYSFADKAWQTITTPVPVMQGRTNHSAAYLQDSQSIVVYAGNQQDTPSWLSSQTFLVSTQPPYNIESFTSAAPPANLPVLQPWDSGSVVMVGGSVLNTQISIFSPEGGWAALSTTLLTPLNPGARGTLIAGSDGSKVLEVYDASVSPNNVAQIVLLGAGGAAATTGQMVSNGTMSRHRRRDLSLDNWPTYNNHFAPTVQRTDFSVVQDPNGLAVISGGNSKTPIAIFNQEQNNWIDANKFFNVKNQQPLKPTTTSRPHTTTSLPTATSTSTPSSTAGSSSGMSSHDRMLRTLGIILGVLFGIAVLFILILLFIRWRKRKRREKEGWLDEKSHGERQMSFADRGASFMKEAGGTVNSKNGQQPPNTPWRQSKNGSHTSMAIVTGAIGKRLSNKHAQKNSYDSTTPIVKERKGETVELADIEKPPLSRRMTPRLERSDRGITAQYGPSLTEQDARGVDDGTGARANRNRSSGWSKYFATSQPTGPNGLSHIPSAYVKSTTQSDGSTYSTDRNHLSEHSRIPSSTLVPALAAFSTSNAVDDQPVSHVAMKSPAFNDSREDLAKRGSTSQGQKGLIVNPNRPRSQSETISSYGTSSARTSDFYNDGPTTSWTPTGTSFKDHLNSRPPSNGAYDASEKRVPSRGKSSHFFPGAGTSYRPPKSPKQAKLGHSAAPRSSWAAPPPVSGADTARSNWPQPQPQTHKAQPSADYSKPAERRAAAAATTVEEGVWPVPPKSIPPKSKPTNSFIPPTAAAAEERDSTMTVFPRGVPSAYYANRGQQQPQPPPREANEDLGWLNLGLSGSQTRL